MSFFNLPCVPILISLQLQHEMAVESARIFYMDCYYQTLILARRISGMGGTHMLKKINLSDPNQNEDIKLPSNTKAVKDLHVSPCGRLVLLASMGKKLSIISMGCNKVVISYSLPTRNAAGLVAPAIVTSLGTLVPVIRASGFAITATATTIGTVVGSFR
ncbi:hypothetical protein ACSBR2_042360 [Camellia fascicularis]